MITCRLIIVELPNGAIAFSMDPEQNAATKAERRFATILDIGIQEAAKYALDTAGRGEMVEGENIAAHARKMLERAQSI